MEFLNSCHHPIELNHKAMLNSSSNLYKSDWINLVFKDRNKNYGAYSLRAESSFTTMKALFIAAPVFIALFVGPQIYSRMHPQLKTVDVEMMPVQTAPPPVKDKIFEKKLSAPKPEPVKEKLKTVALSSNIKVVDRPVLDIKPPTLEDLQGAVVGQVTQEGAATTANVTPLVTEGKGNGTGTEVTDNAVYDASGIDKFPEFEGGMAAWAKYIRKNLRYPEAAQDQGIQGRVSVSFVVEKDGSISDVTILKGIGGGCDEEAMRVIKKSPKWRAGQQQNNKVRVRYTMPISFLIG